MWLRLIKFLQQRFHRSLKVSRQNVNNKSNFLKILFKEGLLVWPSYTKIKLKMIHEIKNIKLKHWKYLELDFLIRHNIILLLNINEKFLKNQVFSEIIK